MALADVEADECPGCGQPASESTADEGMGRYTARNVTCHGCLAAAQKVKGEDGPGVLTQVIDKRRARG